MGNPTRRQFIKALGATAAFLSFKGITHGTSDSVRLYKILVAGDSIAWGQGVEEKDKFYSILKNWLQDEVFRLSGSVDLKVKAHSGSRVYLHEDEARALDDGEIDITRQFPDEVNFSFPTVMRQIDVAKAEYGGTVQPDLVLLSAGITGVTVAGILNPFLSNKKLRKDIQKYSGAQIYDLLKHTSSAFPRSDIMLLGYYQMVSKKSSTAEVLNAVLELYDVPPPIKALFTNPLSKQLLKGIVHHGMAKRSAIWAVESEKAMREAIAKVNLETGSERVFYVDTPINAENCYGTKNSLLWGMAKKKDTTEDPLYERRAAACSTSIDEIKRTTKIKLSKRFCSFAGLGHPNIAGSKAYAEKIKEKLLPRLQKTSLQ